MIKKLDALNQVSEFQKTFGAPILDTPQIPLDRQELKVSLIKEELNELIDAIAENDLVEVLDAFCDLQYVLTGAILEFGFGSVFVDKFNEVHRSNMTKACSSLQEALDTIEFYKDKGQPGHYKELSGKWVVFRDSDNKVLKSINYSPAIL